MLTITQDKFGSIHVASSHDDYLVQTLLSVHQKLYTQMQNAHWDVHPVKRRAALLEHSAASRHDDDTVLTLAYYRSEEVARQVERMIGMETDGRGDAFRHPSLEVRLAEDHFAIELVLSTSAWLDQQNFMGKMTVNRHRHAFRKLLHNLNDETKLGFWAGSNLSDMHVKSWQLSRGQILEEWLSTFADGRDLLRAGVWYTVDPREVSVTDIVDEAMHQLSGLYELYKFITWTSSNNYRSFYEKALQQGYY